MFIRLEDIQNGKTEHREVQIDRETIELVNDRAVITDGLGKLAFRRDPMGFVVKWEVTAKVTTPCIRCGVEFTQTVAGSDWTSLRTLQPEDGHVVLAGSEMNVRFLEDTNFDMNAFVLELVELECPTYPRHEEGDPECKALEAMQEEEKDSPFNVLSKFLND